MHMSVLEVLFARLRSYRRFHRFSLTNGYLRILAAVSQICF